MTELKANQPFEVTEKQYRVIMHEFSGCAFGRVDENGKFWIKPVLWLSEIQKRLEQLK